MKRLVYITKYALTRGIFSAQADIKSLRMCTIGEDFNILIYHKNEWFFNQQDAIKHAEEMRTKKIKSLETQIKKLKSLNFKC
jgi:hypothetical protein